LHLRIVLLLCCLAGFLTAQTSPTGLSTCSLSVPSAPLLRSEGLNELIGDIDLNCTGGTPTLPGKPVPTVNIYFSLNTGIANPIVAGNVSNFLAIADDPVPANQVLAPYDASAGLSFSGALTGTGTGVNFSSGAVPNVYQGLIGNANQGAILGMPFDPLPGGGVRTIRLTNIRVNANGFASSSPGSPLSAQVSIASNSPALVFNSQPLLFPFVTVANVQSGVTTSVVPAHASHAASLNYSLAAANPALPIGPVYSVLQFGENFPGSLFPPATNDTLNTTVSNTAALADFGTRLKVKFNNIPSGVRIFVSVGNVNPATGHARTGPLAASGTSGPQAQLLSGGTVAGTTGLAELSLTNGSGSAVWSVTGADASTADTYSFAVYPVFFSGGTIDTAPPAPTNINVTLSLTSGTSGPLIAQPAVPPPALTVFTINSATGQTPLLSATVDPRPCLVGAPYTDPANACSPGNNPQVIVSSDSGALTPLFSTSTAGGVKITGTFPAGGTPVNGTLQVTAPGAAAGTYQQTLTFSAPGAANSLQVPYSVTVLPQNGPAVKPNGLVDAFSFQGGSVAPGQVFALFGANIGPASLVSGAVSAAGIVSTTVGNTQVLFDGVPAPLLYVVQGQLSGVAPFALKGKTSSQVQVVYNNVKSPAITVPVVSSSLSIATADGSGGGGGVTINADGTLNSASHPASVGDTIVIYAAYAGPFANGVNGTDGRTTTAAPYPAPSGPVSVTIGGVAATNIPYFGNAPTLLESVMQINVVIPAGVKSGASIPLSIAAGSTTSSGHTTIAVK
jgi:uncharacterized protein (TIGR03437 family)